MANEEKRRKSRTRKIAIGALGVGAIAYGVYQLKTTKSLSKAGKAAHIDPVKAEEMFAAHMARLTAYDASKSVPRHKDIVMDEFVKFFGDFESGEKERVLARAKNLAEEYPHVADSMRDILVYGKNVQDYGMETLSTFAGGFEDFSRGDLLSKMGNYAMTTPGNMERPERFNRVVISTIHAQRMHDKAAKMPFGMVVPSVVGSLNPTGQAGKVEDFLTHEFGHMLHYHVNRDITKANSLGEIPHWVRPMGAKPMSIYATTAPTEFMAETFTHHKLIGTDATAEAVVDRLGKLSVVEKMVGVASDSGDFSATISGSTGFATPDPYYPSMNQRLNTYVGTKTLQSRHNYSQRHQLSDSDSANSMLGRRRISSARVSNMRYQQYMMR